MILCREEHQKAVDKHIFLEVRPLLMHVIAAKAVAFKELLEPQFRQYQQNIVNNAVAMAEAFRNVVLR